MEKSVVKGLLNYLYQKNSIFIPMEIKDEKIRVDDYVDCLYRCSSLIEKDSVLSILSGNLSVQSDPAMKYLVYTDSIYKSDIGTNLVTYAGQLNEVRRKYS